MSKKYTDGPEPAIVDLAPTRSIAITEVEKTIAAAVKASLQAALGRTFSKIDRSLQRSLVPMSSG